MDVEWANSRRRGLSRAKALHITKSVERPLRFSAFFGVRPKLIPGHSFGRGCATQPVRSCRGALAHGHACDLASPTEDQVVVAAAEIKNT